MEVSDTLGVDSIQLSVLLSPALDFSTPLRGVYPELAEGLEVTT
jgi:hypothetical protein